MGKFKAIEDVWEYVNAIPMFSKAGDKASNFGLENISAFCSRIGNPQHSFKSIHVAGTNGKGTTCNLLETVYLKGGYKTGMFTSPHLERYNERVKISGEEIRDSEVLTFFNEVEAVLDDVPLTYFEISTVLAFWCFAKEKVDLAIIEAGLGGRLDSTNIISPELSIITSIAKDHEAILGNTVEKIALEKAGIIKENIPVVLGSLDEISEKVISNVAESKGSRIIRSSRLNPDFEKGFVQLKGLEGSIESSFIEPVNAWNIATVYSSMDTLRDRFSISEMLFKESIEGFTGVSARFEKLHPNKQWYFSGSHNEQAIDAMIEGVKTLETQKKTLFLSMMKEKVRPEILSKFYEFDHIYFYEQTGERAASFNEVKKGINCIKVNENNIKMILKELKTELVIFAGSFYFYSIVKRWLTN